MLPTPWPANVTPMHARIRAAVGKSFRPKGVIHLTVKIGEHERSTVFEVSQKLATNLSLKKC